MPGATFKEGCTPRVALVQAVLDKESLLQFCALGASLPHTCLALLLEVRVSTDRSAAVSDATVSAKTISGVCLSNEVQESALGRNQRKEEGVYVDELWEDGLTYRK